MTSLTRRDLAFAALCAALAATVAAPAAAQAPEAADPFWFVDPELRPAARQIQKLTYEMPPLSVESLPALRRQMASAVRPPSPDVPFVPLTVPGADGQPGVTVYLINAKPGASRPGIVHLHGGGFVLGSAAGAVADLQGLARDLDCTILAVEYRLAPETSFAGSTEDTYAALRWLHAHAGTAGVDPARIAVMGESAGGGHAALLAIAARDRGELPPLAFQLLVYPMLDDRTGSSRSVPAPLGVIGWTAPSNRFGWASFLGETPGRRSVPAQAVPARTRDLSGLPPAFIGVGSIDLFLEESIAYADHLKASGVPVELNVVTGAFHGFDTFPADTQIARRFNAAKHAALRRALSL
ncbi:alpha/beta hydrolase [Aureimonas sp. AU12]|uniref:alpha/beta hydrolase n=1 Tax=Aureimonas sp. AU12 TaxID=1638161 RepID=UPI0007821589|nr:alpha/beta hydrolase [Aureimonas sp. AU12]